MKIVASIQARMGSSRLPGKVLADVCGKPMMLWQVERTQKSRLIDKVIVATTTSSKDNQIEEFCKEHDIDCYRGSEEDVLERITELLRHFEVDLHLEFCGDTPLSDPQIIDEFIAYFMKNSDDLEYVSSAPRTTYPPGLEVTLYLARVLIEVDKLIDKDDPLREHAGYNITRFPEKFRLQILEAPTCFHSPETYLEVDTPEDLELLRIIVKNFVRNKQEHFGLKEILGFLSEHPELAQSNSRVERRWKSLYAHEGP